MTTEYLRKMTDEELAQLLNNMSMSFPHTITYLEGLEVRSWLTELAKRLTSKPTSPQWHRHEGGEMPEGVGEDLVFAVSYEHGKDVWFGTRAWIDWSKSFWYIVLPPPPAPPKKERWVAY